MTLLVRFLLTAVLSAVFPLPSAQADPVRIGSRLELFVDGHVIENLAGGARLRLHRPAPREIAIVLDAPWEGNNSNYVTVFRDGPVYRMYYRGRQMDLSGDKLKFVHGQVYCYAESTDGIHWKKPNLGLFEFQGSKEEQHHLEPRGFSQLRAVQRRQSGRCPGSPLQGAWRDQARRGSVRLSVIGWHSLVEDAGGARCDRGLLRLAEPCLLGRRAARIPRVPS